MTDRPGIIYLAVNKSTQMAYIGQTTYDLAYRIKGHHAKRHLPSASHFQRSLAKHGIERFDFAVLESCASKPELNEAERKWIKHFGSITPGGYNIGSGGEGSLFEKRSAAWHAAVRSPEARAKKSAQTKAWRARQTPEERAAHNAKVGAAHRGRKNPKHLGDGNPAKKPESRVKISEGLRRSWQDPEVRERRRLAQLRRHQ